MQEEVFGNNEETMEQQGKNTLASGSKQVRNNAGKVFQGAGGESSVVRAARMSSWRLALSSFSLARALLTSITSNSSLC